uniref:Polyprotein protein n=1 Tax=Solanum tuberosum TaxID=4113 RepID=M1DIK2_SOLTU
MIYQIGNISLSEDVSVVRVEKILPEIIDKAIKVSSAPLRVRLTQCEVAIEAHGVRLDGLTTRIDAREKARAKPTSTSRPPLTQALIYQIGNLSYSTDVRASHLEQEVPKMIARSIEASMCPVRAEVMSYRATLASYGDSLDNLTTKVEERQMRDDYHVSAEALSELQYIKESIVHVTLERSRLEASKIGSSGVSPSKSTIPPPNVLGTNAPIDATLLPRPSYVSSIDAWDDSTLSEP